jgi:hypothetical protein
VLIAAGWQVVEAGTPIAAARAARSLGELGLPFVVCLDRGMPTTDGSSFDGWLEVMKRLAHRDLRPPVLLMADRLTKVIQARARRLGIARIVFRPTLSRLDPEQFAADLRAFGAHLAADVLPLLAESAEAPPPLGLSLSAPVPQTEEAWREAAALQKRLAQLRRPQDAAQITLLIMGMAREFFERAVLFIVKDEELRGLGGFGPTDGDDIVLLVREVAIGLGEPGLFPGVVASGRPFQGVPQEDRGLRQLLERVGRLSTKEVAILPLVTNRETIAVLYGDNPTSGRALPRLDALLVFLDQAGVALENAFLQRKLDARLRRDR